MQNDNARCEYCGEWAVGHIIDVRRETRPDDVYYHFEPYGGLHHYCKAHMRKSRCYELEGDSLVEVAPLEVASHGR